MIKAIIFDCFGVLTTEGWLPFKAKYFQGDAELNRQATELNQRADAGLISHQDFLEAVAELANVTPAEVSAAIDVNMANEQLFDYIATHLKSKYKIGFLSNAAANWLKELFTREQLKLFDAISLSYEKGFIKPYPEAYEVIAGQLMLPVEACVLVDDQERHCAGARAAGMQAVLYKDFEQMKGDLEQILAADAEG
jgi:HAD superfamily hydrolase (TIGR01509 family)